MCQPTPRLPTHRLHQHIASLQAKRPPIAERPFAQWNSKAGALWRTGNGQVSNGCGSSCLRFHRRSYNSLQKIRSLAKATVNLLQLTIEIGRLSLLRTGFSPQHKYLPRRQDMLQAPISFPTGGMPLINSL